MVNRKRRGLPRKAPSVRVSGASLRKIPRPHLPRKRRTLRVIVGDDSRTIRIPGQARSSQVGGVYAGDIDDIRQAARANTFRVEEPAQRLMGAYLLFRVEVAAMLERPVSFQKQAGGIYSLLGEDDEGKRYHLTVIAMVRVSRTGRRAPVVRVERILRVRR
jgi:hypothetical protein